MNTAQIIKKQTEMLAWQTNDATRTIEFVLEIENYLTDSLKDHMKYISCGEYYRYVYFEPHNSLDEIMEAKRGIKVDDVSYHMSDNDLKVCWKAYRAEQYIKEEDSNHRYDINFLITANEDGSNIKEAIERLGDGNCHVEEEETIEPERTITRKVVICDKLS